MSITGEVAKQSGDPRNMIATRSQDFATVLPSQWIDASDAWVRLAQSAIVKNDQLLAAAKRNPASAMRALLDCARLGHEPGTNRFYLVPKGNSVEGWESYLGVIQRILNSGLYQKVIAEVVYEGEDFDFDPNEDEKPKHRPNWSARSKGAKMLMSYAYAVKNDGTITNVGIADPGYIAKVRAMGGPSWNKWEYEMTLKCAITRLEKFVTTSSEDRTRGAVVVDRTIDAPEADLQEETVITQDPEGAEVNAYPAEEEQSDEADPGVEDAVVVDLGDQE